MRTIKEVLEAARRYPVPAHPQQCSASLLAMTTACTDRDHAIAQRDKRIEGMARTVANLEADLVANRAARAEQRDTIKRMEAARDEYARLARAYLTRLQVLDPEGYGNVKAVDL